MATISLKESLKPRILAVDFSEEEIQKLSSTGLNVKRAFTGLFDDNKYCIPSAIQEAEIILLHCHANSFQNIKNREKHLTSIPEGPDFDLLLKEVWQKGGWTVIFIDENVAPYELNYLGIQGIGLVNFRTGYISESEAQGIGGVLRFPKFKGEEITVSEDELGELLKRYVKSANWLLLAKNKTVTFQRFKLDQEWVVTDTSSSPFAMAIKLCTLHIDRVRVRQNIHHGSPGPVVPVYRTGGIIILPDFGKDNATVAQTLVQEYVSGQNPLLFSVTGPPWLTDYKPETEARLYRKRAKLNKDMDDKLSKIDEKIKIIKDKLFWMDLLLIGKGDNFKTAVAKAFRFLGFGVKDVDKSNLSDIRKHEDLHIRDARDKSFFLLEAKATKRGASEDFIEKVQKHQESYSRKNDCPIPEAILIINHSYDLEPIKRKERFYSSPDILARLKNQHIKAVDSCVIHALCQKVLAIKLTKQDAREFIKNIFGASSGYSST
jgi:hypothetical protein